MDTKQGRPLSNCTRQSLGLHIRQTTKQACSKIQAKDILVVRNPYLRTISFDSRLSKRGETPPTHPPAAEQARGQNVNECVPPSFKASSAKATRRQGGDVVKTSEGGSLLSYTGIQADPGEVLLNGVSMMANFAPTAVRLDNFDT